MYKVISTFSGIGGSSTGYKMAGFEVLAAVEFLDYQAANYRLNYPNTKLYQQDIRTLDPLKILEENGLKVGELDILDGSPPCSSFSTAGNVEDGWGKTKKYGNRVQKTDDLFYEYIRFIKAIQPKVFVAENVSGLLKGSSKGMFNVFFNEMKSCGYNVKAKLLNAANYGVPQIRQRVIFIGVRNDLNLEPVFPKPQIKTVSLSDAFKVVVNSKEDLKEVNIERFAIYTELLKMQPYGKSDKYMSLLKEHPNKPCRTLTATNGSCGAASVCHWNNRKFTVNECKAITSFPQDWKTTGKSYAEKVEGFGRAVPPLMMKAIAETIKIEILDKLPK
ncbi:MAG TPA: DNA (cytosine-5-)-methyltransferase [Paludibacter sp.]